MTTPHDARPVGIVQVGAFGGVYFSPLPEISQLTQGTHSLYTAADYDALRNELDQRTAQMIIHNGQALACSAPVKAAFEALRYERDKLQKDVEGWRETYECTVRGLDALRSEVERLRGELNLSRAETHQMFVSARDWATRHGQQEARAEAAEARVAELTSAVRAMKFDVYKLAGETRAMFDGQKSIVAVQEATIQPLLALLTAQGDEGNGN